ncbi:PilW family protein [Gallaecimonas sp. GXIMD4217]|uniref:PilW family protein n=1 Tax=Gallaecimonas sp. GXIMD4217 TaxID=3131927 RepID=UPI00311AD156
MKKHNGFSLIELMIAMTLGLVMALAISAVFVASKRGAKSTEQAGELQENARIAMQVLRDEVSHVGFMGDISGQALVPANTSPVGSVTVSNECSGSGNNNGSLPANVVAGTFRLLWFTGTKASLPGCLTDAVDGSTALQIKRAYGPALESGVDSFRNDHVYLLANAVQASFLWNQSGTVPTPPIANGRYWRYGHHLYYIGNETRNGTSVPSLKRRYLATSGSGLAMNSEVLVEGIEAFRIEFGVDTSLDGVADYFVDGDAMTSADWDGASGRAIVSARIYVLARAGMADADYDNSGISYQLGGTTISGNGDHYRRFLLSSTVQLANPQFATWRNAGGI